MPALFAYLIAVGLLLGGGYGALSWLAEPERPKVVAKVKPKPLPRYDVTSNETNGPDLSISSSNASSSSPESKQAGPGSNHQPPTTLAETRAEPDAQDAHARMVEDPQKNDRHDPLVASVDASSQPAKQPVNAVPPAPSHAQVASLAPATAAKTAKRPHPGQTGSHSEKQGLVLMTLRTIEFPDGRRVSRLIPYRRGERALPFQSDD
jgi:hypothetical protein